MKNQKFFTVATIFVFSLSLNVLANTYSITDTQINDIEKRVSVLSYKELVNQRNLLQNEQASLLVQQENTQNPSSNKVISGRLSEIAAELSAIQKALIAIVGAAAINSITDDGYNDNVPPVITVNGSNPATVELGATYSDQGATAQDAFHGSTSVTTSGSVNTNVVGNYVITYTATDLDGNTATATRTVNVVDTTAPVITITGDNPATTELGDTYTDAGATASDLSGDIEVVSSGTVDTDTLGENTITYSATDASGNSAEVSRVVNVVDTTAPVFTSASTFVVDEGVTTVGTVTTTDLQAVTYSISDISDSYYVLSISSTGGVITITPAADYESQTDPSNALPYSN